MTEAQHDDVPGTLVHHTPAASGRYNGCPSIVVLPSGDLLASHSYFGPSSAQRNSFIYASSRAQRTRTDLAGRTTHTTQII